jgi:hypothetical protein
MEMTLALPGLSCSGRDAAALDAHLVLAPRP